MKFYEEEFEAPFLKNSETEYIRKSQKWMNDFNCQEYVQNAHQVLTREEKNSDEWLEKKTKNKLISIVETFLITNQAEGLAKKPLGCYYMFQHMRLDDLHAMYNLFKRD